MPIIGESLLCTAAALIAALYVNGMMRAAEAMERSGRVPRRDWVVLPLLGLMIALLWVGFALLQHYDPDRLGAVAFATFLGLNLGKLIPRPARGRTGTSFGWSETED